MSRASSYPPFFGGRYTKSGIEWTDSCLRNYSTVSSPPTEPRFDTVESVLVPGNPLLVTAQTRTGCKMFESSISGGDTLSSFSTATLAQTS